MYGPPKMNFTFEQYAEMRQLGVKFCPYRFHVGDPFPSIHDFRRGEGYCRKCADKANAAKKKRRRLRNAAYRSRANLVNAARQRKRRRLAALEAAISQVWRLEKQTLETYSP